MSLKDRGKIKWQSAFFMPEHVKMLRGMKEDYYKEAKPILDEYQIAEFETKLCYAMEFSFYVTVTLWEDGFEKKYTGRVHRLDEWQKKIYLEEKSPDAFLAVILFEDIIGIEVLE
ncbi:YolD-like family protein [Peribacillus kribbensis]|uniref:YolD-like family protein n=1 Tax=Peribacillus kribbensis TaxID=356658 RepID=UPI0004013CD2|nr:YolD-like family protein [Peribacillus kribbensis]